MKKAPVDKDVAACYNWGENCLSWVLVDTDGLSVKQETMPTGAREQLHYHNRARQFFFVLAGEAVFYVGDDILNVNVQRGLEIEPGMHHYIENRGTELLEFLVISQPSTNNDRINISTAKT